LYGNEYGISAENKPNQDAIGLMRYRVFFGPPEFNHNARMIKSMTENTESSEQAEDRGVQTVPKNPDPDLPPKAIAARVKDRNLWIGNVGAIKPRLLAEMDLNPDYIVTVNETATAATTDHYPLKDEQVNDHQQFSAAVETTRAHIRNEGTVLVNCSVGVSRSATVVATAIAAEDGISLDAAVAEIRDHRPRANPHPKLQLNAYAYLVTEENRSDARYQIDALVDNMHLRSETDNAIQELVSEESTDQTPS